MVLDLIHAFLMAQRQKYAKGGDSGHKASHSFVAMEKREDAHNLRSGHFPFAFVALAPIRVRKKLPASMPTPIRYSIRLHHVAGRLSYRPSR